MSYVVRCSECREKIYPVERGYPGDPRLRCYEVALEHVRDSEHTDVEVMGGHHWFGDSEPPREFGDE